MALPASDLAEIPSSLHHPEPGVLRAGVLEQGMGHFGAFSSFSSSTYNDSHDSNFP